VPKLHAYAERQAALRRSLRHTSLHSGRISFLRRLAQEAFPTVFLLQTIPQCNDI